LYEKVLTLLLQPIFKTLMDRNSIIGLVLIFAIIISFAYLNQPNETEVRAAKLQRDSIARVQAREDSANLVATINQIKKTDSASTEKVDTAASNNRYGVFGAFADGKESFTAIENAEIKVTVSNKGGRVYSVELKKQKRSDGTPLVLFDGPTNDFSYSFATVSSKAINTADLYFAPQKSDDGKTLSMKIQLSETQYIEQKYSLTEEANIVSYKLNLVGMENVIARNTNYLDLNWESHIPQQEKTYDAENRATTIHYRYVDDEPGKITETKAEKESLKTPVQWVSFKQQYFNTTLIADKSFDNGNIETKNDDTKRTIKTLSANLSIPYNHGTSETFGMKFFYGPNHYKTLAKLNIELERIVPMGWGIFRWVNTYVVSNVFYFLSQYVSSMGILILLLTLIVKTVLFPLVYRSYLSAAKMRILKPELDEIKAKFGDDMQKVQQENMKMYRKAGVNPLGGCVPVLLQMPILIAMFQFFPSAFELRQQAFLWSSDLSTYDSILQLPFMIPGYGNHVSLFAILMTASSIFYTVYNNQMTGVTGQMKWISYFMPLIFLFMLNSYAAGLNYYYFLSNLVTIAQQLGIRRFVDDKALHEQIQESKKKPVTKSKFQSRLEDIAKKRGVDLNQGKKK
jgi:YidC/Oxa1 family membrane protein insertase